MKKLIQMIFARLLTLCMCVFASNIFVSTHAHADTDAPEICDDTGEDCSSGGGDTSISCDPGQFLNGTECEECPAYSTSDAGAVACTCGEDFSIDGTAEGDKTVTDGTCELIPEFTVITTKMPENTTFWFGITAAGTFYVDCGEYGTPVVNNSGTPVNTISVNGNIGTINIESPQSDGKYNIYGCKYTDAREHTIRFAGEATGYSTKFFQGTYDNNTYYPSHYMPAFGFNVADNNNNMLNTYVREIDGSLGHVFRTIGDGEDASQQPSFAYSFTKQPNLTTIPSELFDGISGKPITGMFAGTFQSCPNLSGTIPVELFRGISSSAEHLFAGTFHGCSRLSGTIPGELFSGINSGAESMFAATFMNCSSLSGIPENLFQNVSGGADRMFFQTFHGCSSLSGKIPANLFQNVSGGADRMFRGTFYNCSNITSVPAELFAKITQPAEEMFALTFMNCSSLSEIPENLFENVSGGAAGMFWSTFDGCSSLSGIPENLFKNINTPAYRMFRATFNNCSNITSVPAGLFAEITQPAEEIFARTFQNTGLTEIPYGLFANLDKEKPEQNMFYQTFNGCTNMKGWLPENSGLDTDQGWVPYDMFGGISPVDYVAGTAMTDVFNGTAIATSCPANWYKKDIAFDVDWDGHVSCEQCPDTHPNSVAGATNINECYTSCEVSCDDDDTICPDNATCVYTQSKNPGTEYYNGTCDAALPTCAVESFTCNDGYKKNDTGDACVAIEYTITYDANGGNGTMADITCTYDNQCELTENAFTLNGYVFSGWNTSANGSGTAYDNEAKIENITGAITLYAQWKQCDKGNYCPGDNEEYPCPAFSSSKPGAAACKCGEDFSIDGTEDGDKTVTNGTCNLIPEFTVETTDIPENTTFWFGITAAGTFYVDCGEGGTPVNNGGTPVNMSSINGNIGTINLESPRNDGKYNGYGCKYTDAGKHTIRFAGDATKYSTKFIQGAYDEDTYYTSYYISAFSFYVGDNNNDRLNTYVQKIDGSLGKIFATLDDGTQPSFAHSFSNQKDLTGPIPEKLFAGISGQPITGMFAGTFHNCSKLSGTIPGELFSGISGSAEHLFGMTFDGCSKLSGTIPGELFSGINGGANSMFAMTFKNCSDLTGIGDGLFDNIETAAERMFLGTFASNSKLESIPDGLFRKVSGSAKQMFRVTFYGCSGLSGEIPANLFENVSGGADGMFWGTFNNCSGLTGIGDGLFDKIDTAAANMFNTTFRDCSKMKGIQSNLFQNISGGADGMFWSTFDGCSSLSEIPENLFKNINTPAYRMFRATFWGCSNITSVPAGLFAKITQPAKEMFALTFQNTGLTKIPYGLFANLDKVKPEEDMFDQTFSGCTNMKGWLPENSDLIADQGWVPYDMFGGISPDGYEKDYAMTDVFNGTAIAESCPADWYKKDIAFDVDWSDKVACVPCPDTHPNSVAGATNINGCYTSCEVSCDDDDTICPDNATCVYTQSKNTGTEYYNGTCDAALPTCAVESFTCNDGYKKNDTGDACVAIEYTITYDANGGSDGDMAATECTYGQSCTLSPNAFTLNGYVFSGWNTSANGSGTAYDDKATIENITGAITLYAQWTQCTAGNYCPGDNNEYDCPAFSNSDAGASVCRCEKDFSIDGTAEGDKTVTNGTCELIPEFTVITTNMPENTTFVFGITAAGKFYVDCGEGGTPVSNGGTPVNTISVNGNIGTINIESPRIDGKHYIYGCEYTDAGEHTIHFAGDATGYSTTLVQGTYYPYYVDAFGVNIVDKNNNMLNTYVQKIDGSLGHIFSTIDDGDNASQQPSFATSFANQSHLTGTIPSKLFDGIHGTPITGMFASTFADCPKLSGTIPGDLFSGISGSAAELFTSTFQGCSSLSGKIPENLFQNISGGADGMFWSTFDGCSSLSEIPENLFQNVSGGADRMFRATFWGCSNITSVPAGLFAKITQPAKEMFALTFQNTGLTEIPENLFQNVSGGADRMFHATFSDCSNITSVPAGLFAGIEQPAEEIFAQTFQNTGLTEIPYGLFANLADAKPKPDMFRATFSGCTNMKGWLPENSGLIADQGWVPYDMFGGISPVDYVAGTAMTDVFNGTAIATSCPANWYQYMTGFESDWSGHVSCEQCPESHPNSVAGATNINECYTSCEVSCDDDDTICPDNATCVYTQSKNTGNEYYNGTCDAALPTCAVESFTCNDGYKKNDTGDACVAIEYNVTYNCNGGSGSGSDTAIYDEPFTPRTNICTRSEYEFIGWTIDDTDATNQFTWKYTSDKEMVAVWNQVSTKCAPGEYLPAHATQCEPCKQNHYCSGGTYEITDTDSGIEECTTFATSKPGAVACKCGEDFSIDGKADGDKTVTNGTCKLIPEFTVKTINMEANKTFWVGITAAGTFYVDCGDYGTPVNMSSINGNIGTINLESPLNNGQVAVCGCKYTKAGEYTIHFAGGATKYQRDFYNHKITGEYDDETLGIKPSYYFPSITFAPHTSYNGSPNIKEISGSLGKIFGTLDDGTQPSFAYTFSGASNMTGTIPSELFDGVHGTPIIGMFASTFNNCSKLSGTIPEGLFSGISGNAEFLFTGTFYKCSTLFGAIPDKLFLNISGNAPYMFSNTFKNCSTLSEIPANLFQNVSGGADGMFWSTFTGCSNLSGIPENLFQYIDTSADRMFRATFSECSNITSVPAGLFAKITQPAKEMFARTFRNTGLTKIPYGLFANLDKEKPEQNMFYQTFNGCTNMEGWLPDDVTLTPENQLGWIPVSMFDGMDDSEYSTGYAMKEIFLGADKLATSCPANWYNADIAFAVDWDGHVSCEQCPDSGFSVYDQNKSIETCYKIEECSTTGGNGTKKCYYNTESKAYDECEDDADCVITNCKTGYEQKDGSQVCSPIEYNITYDANGGTTVADTTYTVEDTVPLPEPTRDGYTFAGWYDKENLDGDPVEQIAQGNTGNRTFLAKWKDCQENHYCPGDNEEYPCPAFSYSEPGASVCTCEKDFSIDGKADGGTTVTNGTCQLIPEFTVETTNMATNAKFHFGLSAAGTFYVDCGEGGVLSGSGVTRHGSIGKIVIKTPLQGNAINLYTCTYTTTGKHMIYFAGEATEYSKFVEYGHMSHGTTPAISFHTNNNPNLYIYKIYGSLGHIFGTIDDGDTLSKQPSFNNLFREAQNFVGPIPEELFDGIYGKPVSHMFSSAFNGCRNLTGPIPEKLFNVVSGTSEGLFSWTFGNCTSLNGSIPTDLFKTIRGEPQLDIYYSTFYNCPKLTGEIPPELFSGLNGAPAPYMFGWTFANDTGLTGQYSDLLFAGIDGAPAQRMYEGTFAYCKNITSSISKDFFGKINGNAAQNMFASTFFNSGISGNIPEGLFADITGEPQPDMFNGMFYNCDNLTGKIPGNLFQNIKGTPVNRSFVHMFEECSGLTGFVPPELFAGIDNKNYQSGPMSDIFLNSGIIEQCPEDMYQFFTGFESDWDNRVSCLPCPYGLHSPAGSTSIDQCVADTIECGADFSTMGHQYWDSKNGGYSKCIIEECIDGYHVELNACLPDEQSCAVTNGTGIKTWDYDTKTYGPCVAQRCTPGYTTDASLSDQPISGCSRCANMYVNGEIAVSGYVDECEIASCMYQGEKYILENNECVPICEEETDETGHRYWNGKECVHDCNAGYSQW